VTRLDPARLCGILDAFAGVHLLVVGDLVLDAYVWGDAWRVSPEAPVPVVEVREESAVLGGAANVARNAVALGAPVSLVSAAGDDADAATVRALLGELALKECALLAAPDRVTTRKTRVVARSQQIVRFDRESAAPLPAAVAKELLAKIAATARGAHAAVLADYGKGLLAGLAGPAMAELRRAGLPVAVDPKREVDAYRGAALVKPNLREAEALSGVEIRDDADLARAAAALRARLRGGAVAVTRGARGISLFEGGGAARHVPTTAREVFDVQGAGDTAMAALALSLRAGASLLEAAVVANAAAGVVVGKVGTATASADEVRARLPEAVAAAEGGT